MYNELVPLFTFFLFFWGSLCFPLTRQTNNIYIYIYMYIYIYTYICWGPNSNQVYIYIYMYTIYIYTMSFNGAVPLQSGWWAWIPTQMMSTEGSLLKFRPINIHIPMSQIRITFSPMNLPVGNLTFQYQRVSLEAGFVSTGTSKIL